MDFLTLANTRYSVRKFSDRPVEPEKLRKILEAGQAAPTAVNNQPQSILVIQSKEGLERLAQCTPYTFQAPMALVVCYDQSKSWVRKFDGYNMGAVDASIVATHMMLQAAELDLGTTWVGHFDPDKIKQLFELPNDIIPNNVFPLGYPAKDSQPSTRHTERKPLEDTVTFL